TAMSSSTSTTSSEIPWRAYRSISARSAPSVRRQPYTSSVARARSRGSSCGKRPSSASSAAAANAPSRRTRSRILAAISRAVGSFAGLCAAMSTDELAHLRGDHVPTLFDVVLEGQRHQGQQDDHADQMSDLTDPQGERLAHHALHRKKHQVAPIEDRDRQQVQQPQVDADDGHHPDEEVWPLAPLLAGDLED